MKYLGYACVIVLGFMVPPLGMAMLAVWFFARHISNKIKSDDRRLQLEHDEDWARLQRYRGTHTTAQWVAFKSEFRLRHGGAPKDRNRERLIALIDIDDERSGRDDPRTLALIAALEDRKRQ